MAGMNLFWPPRFNEAAALRPRKAVDLAGFTKIEAGFKYPPGQGRLADRPRV